MSFVYIRLRKVDASQIHIYQLRSYVRRMEYRALFPLAMFSFAEVYSSSNVDGLDVMSIWSCIVRQWHVLQRIWSFVKTMCMLWCRFCVSTI